MKNLFFHIAALSYCASVVADDGTNVSVRTVAEVSAAIHEKARHVHFELAVTALSPAREDGAHIFLAEDATGRELFFLYPDKDPNPIQPGVTLRLYGETALSGGMAVRAFTWGYAVTGRVNVPMVEDARISDILAGRFNLRYVRITGRVMDAFYDDIDRDFMFLIIIQGRDRMYFPARRSNVDGMALPDLIGAEVTFRAIISDCDNGSSRNYAGTTTYFIGFDAIHKIDALSNPNKIPPLENLHGLTPDRIHNIGQRRTSGRVVATWKGDRFLLRREDGEFMRVELVDGIEPPKPDAAVEVVGFVGTDLFNINLSQANWRPAQTAHRTIHRQSPPTEVTADMLLSKENNLNVIASQNFGKTVSIDGIVRNLPASGNDDGILNLESGEFVIHVDASSCPAALDGVEIGCRVKVTGVFVFEANNWRDNATFPKIDNIAIVVRKPEDLSILSRPSWWTTARLLSVIGLLAIAIAATLVWNASLRILAERRGRALYDAMAAKSEAELRSDERTRLATELHDYIAQDLTAISYQLSAAREAQETVPSACAEHLDTADRMLRSCRTELRRCMWDLKNEAIGDPSLANAVRTSINPLLQSSVKAKIRIDIPRGQLSDNTVHAILSIIRELVSNAIRHGHVKEIEITGRAAEDGLMFSVKDNGCGFEPQNCPDETQGHLGLAGIRERAIRLNGELTIISSPGAGTCATVKIKPPPRKASAAKEVTAWRRKSACSSLTTIR